MGSGRSAWTAGRLKRKLGHKQRCRGTGNIIEPALSPVVRTLNPSKTVQLTDLASSLKREGKPIISLTAGEPDFATPEPIINAAKAAMDEGYTKYPPNAGFPELREAIADKLKEDNGLAYADSEILVSNGAKQSVMQGVIAAAGVGDEVIVPAPYWVSYPEMVKLAGAKSVIIDTASDDFVLTPEKLSAALTPNSRLLILCTPSNPTGAVYSLAQLEALAAVVRTHPRLMVMSDEIYEHIVYPPHQHHSFAALEGMRERTFTVNGFSKAFAMTGWRLGYLAAPEFYIKAAAIVQSQITSGASSIAQRAALSALPLRHEEAVQGMVREFNIRRDAIAHRFREIPGIQLLEPAGAFYFFFGVGEFIGEGVTVDGFGPVPDAEALCRYILQVANVALVPGDAFGSPGFIRMSYAASMAELNEAMDRLVHCLSPASKFHRR